MAAIVCKSTVAKGPASLAVADLVGTETIDATVGAGEIAIIMDSAVVNNSASIDSLLEKLMDCLRENNYT